ncbi:hypothetical protein CDAR_438891 [Caerostris darwini]|uniref:Uncharacterized protein n=1 Tax=Caerostris darwini TaxID=1538125 RepID=A0AAV4X2N7_9ARAC|nr:hypothetical protein CDAR_438891 [Caerostris darwini]
MLASVWATIGKEWICIDTTLKDEGHKNWRFKDKWLDDSRPEDKFHYASRLKDERQGIDDEEPETQE